MTALAPFPRPCPPPHPPPLPARRVERDDDPQTSNAHWNHLCPASGCGTWVPNHRDRCTDHEETTT